jgi:long-chain fatty acid transport protein
MEARVAVRFCLLGLSSLLIGSSASAGGYEFPGDGARALGRGGAFAARADDPMAIVVNPAGLASLPGTQIWVSTHLAFAKDCFTRNQPGVAADGTTPTAPVWPDGWGQDPSGNAISYTEVCNEKNKRFSAVPSIAVTWRISKRIGMGFGVIPSNGGLAQRWGGRSYQVDNANGSQRSYQGYVEAPAGSTAAGNTPLVPLSNGQGLLPSPTRFQLVERRVVALYPTIAVGARPFRWMQIGAAFGWGIAGVRFVQSFRNLVSGEEPNAFEGQAASEAKDWFAPRVSASIHFIPHDKVDIVGVFRWDEAFRATGTLEAAVPAIDNGAASGLNTLKGRSTVFVPRPWWITFGVRYADRITRRPDDPDAPGRQSGLVQDPMSSERWDIEANLTYEKNSKVDRFDVMIEGLDAEQGSPLVPPGGINASASVRENWQDQLSVRVGGDWNVIRGKLALRSGFSYETNGFTGIGSKTSKGGTIEFMPLQRFGLHLGLTGRIKRAELTGGFAYYWHTTHNNTNGGTEQLVIDPFAGVQLPGDTVNNGAFSSRIVVGSIAFRYFFMGWGGRSP